MKNNRLAHLFAIAANDIRRLGWRFGLVAFGGAILGVGLVVAVTLICIS